MTWVTNLLVLAGVLTVANLAIYFMFGSDVHAMGLVFLITRLPRSHWTTCKIYHLDPVGPWVGICDRACGIHHAYKACYIMSGVERE